MLPGQIYPSRCVGAVDGGMAKGARAAENKNAAGTARLCGVKDSDMALLAQTRGTHFQHEANDRAMWIVAVQTVLSHWRMHPQKRPALVGVAYVTGFVDGRTYQLIGISAAMRIVAVSAGHQALEHWHVRGESHLGLLLKMTA